MAIQAPRLRGINTSGLRVASERKNDSVQQLADGLMAGLNASLKFRQQANNDKLLEAEQTKINAAIDNQKKRNSILSNKTSTPEQKASELLAIGDINTSKQVLSIADRAGEAQDQTAARDLTAARTGNLVQSTAAAKAKQGLELETLQAKVDSITNNTSLSKSKKKLELDKLKAQVDSIKQDTKGSVSLQNLRDTQVSESAANAALTANKAIVDQFTAISQVNKSAGMLALSNSAEMQRALGVSPETAAKFVGLARKAELAKSQTKNKSKNTTPNDLQLDQIDSFVSNIGLSGASVIPFRGDFDTDADERGFKEALGSMALMVANNDASIGFNQALLKVAPFVGKGFVNGKFMPEAVADYQQTIRSQSEPTVGINGQVTAPVPQDAVKMVQKLAEAQKGTLTPQQIQFFQQRYNQNPLQYIQTDEEIQDEIEATRDIALEFNGISTGLGGAPTALPKRR